MSLSEISTKCPKCHVELDVPNTISDGTEIKCGECGNVLLFENKILTSKLPDLFNDQNQQNKGIKPKTKHETVVDTNENIKYAGFWVRFLAWFVDMLILLGLNSLIFRLLNIHIPDNAISFGTFYLFSWPLAMLWCWLYSSIYQSSIMQATPGKALFRLKVTDYNYERISFRKAIGRYFSKYLSGLLFGIGYIRIGFSKTKQGWHDHLAKTYVIKNSSTHNSYKHTLIGLLISTLLILITFYAIPEDTIPNKINTYSNHNNYTIPQERIFKQTTVPSNTKSHYEYKAISFDYPGAWDITKDTVRDVFYIIYCSQPNDDMLMISVLSAKTPPVENIQTLIKSATRNYKKAAGKKYFSIEVDPIVGNNFKSYAGVSADYTVIIDKTILYGRLQSFNVGDTTVSISKLVTNKNSLDSFSNIIEGSLIISNKYIPEDIRNFKQTTTHSPTDTYYKYKEVSFDCPKGWDITEGVIIEDYIYQINGSTPSDETLVITVVKLKNDPIKSLKKALISTADETKSILGNDVSINIDPIATDSFKDYSGVSACYTITDGSNILFGKAYSFNVGEKTILINKLAQNQKSLDSYFDGIEKSLIISNK